jgi:hypothetical protein
MSNLVRHAENELREAGYFDKDSDYDGMLGEATIALIKTFAAQGHSGSSAAITSNLFNRLSRYGTLSPLRNPMEHAEFIDHSDKSGYTCYQSTRRHSVFSEDGGKTWYDIDKRAPWWKRIFGIRRVYITFPYQP